LPHFEILSLKTNQGRLLFTVGIVFLFLPAFSHIAGKKLNLDLLDKRHLFDLLITAFMTGLVSGSYPALFYRASCR
jgi:hypothetical protein